MSTHRHEQEGGGGGGRLSVCLKNRREDKRTETNRSGDNPTDNERREQKREVERKVWGVGNFRENKSCERKVKEKRRKKMVDKRTTPCRTGKEGMLSRTPQLLGKVR